MFENNFFPHILFGNGIIINEKTSLSDNSKIPYAYDSDYKIREYYAIFMQLGIGLSYVLNDTIEFYWDVVLLLNLNNRTYTSDAYFDDESYNNTIRIEQTWNNPSIGFQVGVKFHTFGSSTMRRKYLKEEILQLEEERQKNIDSIFDD